MATPASSGAVNGDTGAGDASKPASSQANGQQPEASGVAPIAVVGIGVRLPGGVSTTDDYWDLLVNGRNTSRKVPSNRYNVDAFEDKNGAPGTVKNLSGHYLDCDVDKMDATFFSMSKAELEKLDPQERLLLEVIYECMESGGQRDWRGRKIGCYVGSFGEDWLDLYSKDPQHLGMHRILGYGDFALSNRASYEYDLKGPSMTVRTACSSSLVGLHEACQALYNGECEGAVVAGSSLFLSPTMTIALAEQGVLSPTGSCKTFDAKADGYARGEAINAVYIKKLDDALRDGDPIRAVIRGTAANFDGKTVGITNPNSDAHEALMRRAYQSAGIAKPSETGFVECHGTGTNVGDPTETTAVGKVFGAKKGMYIGSVKPNIGHGEGASGLNSLIKAILSLEHNTIPPNINFSDPSPKIKWDKYGFKVPIEATPWPEDRAARVSVNCFGVGGANAHAIVDSAQSYLKSLPSIPRRESQHLFAISAHHSESLQDRANKLFEYADKHPDRVPDMAYTLGCRREALAQRAFAIYDGKSTPELSPAVKPKDPPAVNFVFTGQGAQWPGMGADLLDEYPEFLEDIRAMDAALQKLPHPPSWTIEAELQKDKEESNIQQPEFSQPICTALQIALVNLLKKFGIKPAATVGHSSGEMGAAFAVGALTMEMAIAIAYYRGYITQNKGRIGGMAAVGLGRADATPYLKEGVVIACENSPKNVTISGDNDKLDEVLEQIKADKPDTFARRLRVERAYHSHHMKEIGEEYQKLLEDIVQDKKPQASFFSSVTAKQIKRAGNLGPSYWKDNLENPVQFSPAVQLMLHAAPNDSLFLEVGPHSAMAGPLRDIFKSVSLPTSAAYVPTVIRNESGPKSILSTLGRLFQENAHVDLAVATSGRNVLTDLPNYSWKHDTVFWNESRVTRDWRLRKFPPHEILGVRIMETDDLEPAWRNMFRLDHAPWARDHKIQEDVIMPGAAYIAMAIEALRQLHGGEEVDASLRQVDIKSALVLRESTVHEIVTHLRPFRLTSSLDSDWWEFSVSSFNGATWAKHCTGQIRAGQDHVLNVEDVDTQPRHVSTAGWYRIMQKVGLNYGPEFQLMDNISALPGQNSAAATIKDVDRSSGSSYPLHPSVIDQVLQAFTVAIADGMTRQLNKLCVPRYIDEMYIKKATSNMRLGVSAVSTAIGAIKGSATIKSGDDVVLSLKGGEFVPMEDDSGEGAEPIPAAQLIWKPDVDFVAPGNLIQPQRNDKNEMINLEKLALLSMLDTLSRIEGITETSDHLTKLRNWLAAQKTKAVEGKYEHVQDSARLAGLDQTALATEIKTTKVEVSKTSGAQVGDVMSRLAQNAASIFKGEADPTEVVSHEGGLNSVFDFVNSSFDYRQYLELFCHSVPTPRVLEIGAGEGGITAKMLGGLVNAEGERAYIRYTFADSSEESLEGAMEAFKEHENMEFKVLDISKDPTQQDFEAGSYDLVVAANSLHKTSNIGEAIQNARKLIKPGGRLLLQELSPSSKMFNFIMGFRPDWWVGADDGRKEEPYLAASRWDTELREAGLTGSEAIVFDNDAPYQMSASIVSRAPPQSQPQGDVTILSKSSDGPAKALQEVLNQQGFSTSISSFDEEPRAGADVISLLDLDEPFYYAMSEEDFGKWHDYISKFPDERGLLWVTGLAQVASKDPRYATAIGATRNIRSELSKDWATLETDVNAFNAESIAVVFEKFRNRAKGPEFDPDWEYAIMDNRVMIPRYHPIDMEKEARDEAGTGPRKLDISRFGALQTLGWVEDDVHALQPDQVEVSPRAVGMNFKDVLVAMGIVEGYKPGLGIECSGVISKIGSNVQSVSVGDRVMSIGHGCFTTNFVTESNLVIRMPNSLGFEEAATIPCVYATAIHALINLGGLEKDQTVLVHSACGGVGIAAINICQMLGAKIYATVGNPDKVKYLMDNFGLPRDRIFNSRDSSFYGDLMEATNGRGVDLVLNSLSGELLHVSWKCVAQFGKMLEIGKRDFIGKGQLGMEIFESNRSFHGIDMSQMAVERPDMCKKILTQFNRFYESGHIKPVTPMKTFKATEVRDAFRYMQKGQHIGKIVVTMPEDRKELEVDSKPHQARFRADMSYLMVGGLGGLGRSVSNWMIQNGARHLVFLSRSAGDSDKDKDFIRELESQGCGVQTIKASVTDQDDVIKGVAKAEKPIAGVFHMTMVLRDRGILELTHDDWYATADPKVKGAWNLHKALENSPMDFFISFSSISYVVGQIGQANYSSANAYLAAFAQYRHALGLPASVLNVGVMDDVGYVVENQALLDQFRALNYHTLKENDLLDALSYMTAHQKPNHGAEGTFVNPAELVIGLKSTKALSDTNNRAVWKRDVRMAEQHLQEADSEGGSGNEDFSQFLKNVNLDTGMLDQQANIDFLTRQVGEIVYNLMSRSPDELDVNMTLSGLGVDSLVAIEIRNWWRHTLGVNASVLEIMGAGSISMLGKLAADGIKRAKTGA